MINTLSHRGQPAARSRLRALVRFCCLACCLGRLPSADAAQSIADSKHNLSASGPGTIKAVAESEICIFCHTPHQASPEAPLWNRSSPGTTYVPYSSTTARASIGQPKGSSKLCLSCHDGTIALGMVRSRSNLIPFQGGTTLAPSGRSGLTTDLADDHPISFAYDPALAVLSGHLHNPGTLTGPVRLEDGRVECVSCHDPHDDQYGDFLVQHNVGSALCLTCHDFAGWNGSAHATSGADWNGAGPDPWPHTEETTVADNACENCHRPHSAGTPMRLLNFRGEEQNCYPCHNGNVARENIEREFNKFSVHPVAATSGVHDPTEDLVNPPRHVECVDCHNPHASQPFPADPPVASGALAGVRGVSLSGQPLEPIRQEAELCFRCHADSIRRGAAPVPRQVVQTNTRLEFDPANASYHPVATFGRNSEVPSLVVPYTVTSLINCTDCHNNDQGPGAGGVGPRGPHGSAFRPLLERQLLLSDFSVESAAVYALCYKCHARQNLLADRSFATHRLHVVQAQVACTTCHDPHGVRDMTHLINFNLTYVTPSSGGRLEFADDGPRHGRCYLTCHGRDHDPEVY